MILRLLDDDLSAECKQHPLGQFSDESIKSGVMAEFLTRTIRS